MRSISRPFSESPGTRTHRVLGLLAAFILMAGGLLLPGARFVRALFSTVAQSDENRMKVKAEGEGNSLTVKAEGETVFVDVQSRSGIGRATVEHALGEPPEKVIVRLHLKGLEEFRLSYDRMVITASVSSNDSHHVTQSIRSTGGDEQPITSTSPLWLGVRIVSDQATSRIPLEQGHFEITLPKDLLGKGRRSFSIRWVDFYR